MFESFGFDETTAKQISVLFALGLGLVFGVLAQRTKFCFRRALVGEDRRGAMGVWMMALAASIIGTQAAVAAGLIDFSEHRFMAQQVPVLAIVLGGLMFGAGMVLTRGCVSRLTVLTGSGNLRALMVLIVFAITAHATLKGVLAPMRVALGSATVDLTGAPTLAALPGGAVIWAAVLALVAIGVAVRSGNRPAVLVAGAVIGLLAAVGWIGTGFVLFDEFDPIGMESLSFTSPSAEGLFYILASSAVPAGFGTGLILGVVLGALAASVLSGQFHWQSFSSPRQTGRYLAGAALMGVGGVLAGGCTVGAGLSGIATLSLAAMLALIAIAVGAVATHTTVDREASLADASGVVS